MARPEGFEPSTLGFVVRYSIQLSYGRIPYQEVRPFREPRVYQLVRGLVQQI